MIPVHTCRMKMKFIERNMKRGKIANENQWVGIWYGDLMKLIKRVVCECVRGTAYPDGGSCSHSHILLIVQLCKYSKTDFTR